MVIVNRQVSANNVGRYLTYSVIPQCWRSCQGSQHFRP